MPNLSHEHPASSKTPIEDLKDMDVLCPFKTNIESQNLDQGYIKYPNEDQDGEPPASSKAPDEDLKDIDVLCTIKIKLESQNSNLWCIKDQ